ncbi:hypothetical protein ACFVSW_23455 [Neobacillus sp. NPDC058068]|uniref:hypothetical protein n=1 Tax=Neobacillus sp. NPDC058068 TaxID=3346325 RepID=UPI0036DB9478
MQELIGTCKCCDKEIFCFDGFFNGVITKEKENYCFECYEKLSKTDENPPIGELLGGS